MSNMDFLSEFGSVTAETKTYNNPDVREYSDRTNWISKDIRLAKPKENVDCRYRLIATPGSPPLFSRQVSLHYKVGTAQNAVSCSVMQGKECKLCQNSRELYATGQKDAGYERAAKIYHLLWVIDRADPSVGPMIWQVPQTTIQAIWNLMEDRATKAILPVNDLLVGFDLFFVRKKNQGNFLTVQNLIFDREKSPLCTDNETMIKWLGHIKQFTPLDPFLTFMSLEDQAKAVESEYSDTGEPDGFEAGRANPAPAGVPAVGLAPMSTSPPSAAESAVTQTATTVTPTPDIDPAFGAVTAPPESVQSTPAPTEGKVTLDNLKELLANRNKQ